MILVEQLREEIETLRGQVEDEQGNGDMLQRGMFREFKVGCIFPMNVLSILPHAKFGRNDHRDQGMSINDSFRNGTQRNCSQEDDFRT